MANKQIILLRHGKSDWNSGESRDHARPLNDRGRRDVPKVGEWLGTLEFYPSIILCSDARRTRETLDLIMENSGWDEEEIEIRILAELYLASSSTIQSGLQGALSDHDSVLVVGHNPGMDLTLLELYPDSRELAGDKLMTTAAVAILESPDESLSEISLTAFRRPRDL
jgi:phosphohistidine phosphatase